MLAIALGLVATAAAGPLVDPAAAQFVQTGAIEADGDFSDWGTPGSPAEGVYRIVDETDLTGTARWQIARFWFGLGTAAGGTDLVSGANPIEHFYFRMEHKNTSGASDANFNVQLNLGGAPPGKVDHLFRWEIDNGQVHIALFRYTDNPLPDVGAFTTGSLTLVYDNTLEGAPAGAAGSVAQDGDGTWGVEAKIPVEWFSTGSANIQPDGTGEQTMIGAVFTSTGSFGSVGTVKDELTAADETVIVMTTNTITGRTSFETAAAAAVAFVDPPATAVVDATLDPVTVEVLDGDGARLTDATHEVTIAIASGPGGATLSGTKVVAAESGLATFSDLSLDTDGSYTLEAFAPGLVADTSGTFDITEAEIPEVEITSPSDGATVQSQSTITGTATDNMSVAGVELEIQRDSDDQYWNGTGWQAGQTTVSAAAADGAFDSGTESWEYDASDIDGDDDYTVTATASDPSDNTASASVGYTIDATGPSITGVTGPDAGDYGSGSALDLVFAYDEAVVVDEGGGTPSVALDIGGQTRQAEYHSGSGTQSLTFRYTVQTSDDDSDGIGFASTTIALNGGTMRDAVGNDAERDFTAFAPDLSDVNAIGTAPTIESVVTTANGVDELLVTFSDGVWTGTGQSGALSAPDFAFSDASGGGVTVQSVTHSAGGSTATLTLSGDAVPGSDELAAVAGQIFDQLDNAVTDDEVGIADGTPPSISNVALGQSGSNLTLSFRSDEPLGGGAAAIAVSVDGPSTGGVYAFDRSDFAEGGAGPYTYTLTTAQAYDDGDGVYTAAIDDAVDAAGNDGADGSATDTHIIGDLASLGGVNPDPLVETALAGATLTIDLNAQVFVAGGQLDPSDFSLPDAPAGTTIGGVSRQSNTRAVLTLAFDGTDFDAAESLSARVLASALVSGAGPADTESVDVHEAAADGLDLDGPTGITAGQVVGPFTLTSTEPNGTSMIVETAVTFDLASTSSSTAFYSDAGGTNEISTVTIPSGQSQATFYYRDTKPVDATIAVSWKSGGDDLGDHTHDVSVGVGAASPATSTVTASPSSVPADGSSKVTVTVRLKDAAGNDLTSGGDAVEIETTAGTLSAVTDHGDGSYTATLTSAGTPGTATITARVNGQPLDDTAEVTFASTVVPAERLELSGPTTVVAGKVSPAFTVMATDDSGDPAPVAAATRVDLTTTSEGDAAFFADSNGANPITRVTIPAGETTATFHYRDTRAANPMLRAVAVAGDDIGEARYDVLVVDPAEPKFVELAGPRAAAVGLVGGPFELIVRDEFGNASPVKSDAVFALTAQVGGGDALRPAEAGGGVLAAADAAADGSVAAADDGVGTFFANRSGTTRITQITIPAGQARASFFFRPNIPGQLSILAVEISDSELGQASLSHELSVTATVSLDGPAPVDAGEVSGAFVLTSRDAHGQRRAVLQTTTFRLASDSDGEPRFYSDAAGRDRITSLTLEPGESTARFHYRDTRAGTHTVTATWTGGGADLGSASQSIRVDPVPPPSPETTLITASPESLDADGESESRITVEVRDIFGNRWTKGGESVTLRTSHGTLSPAVDQGDGTFTATLTSATSAGTARITGTLNGEPIVDDAEVEFTASGIVFLTEPTTAHYDSVFDPPVRVAAVDGAGQPVAGYTGTVRIELIDSTEAGGELRGSASAELVDGVATFEDAAVSRPGTGYRLSAILADSAMGPVRSEPFEITRPAVDLQVSVQVSESAPALGDTVVFTVRVTNNGPVVAEGVGIDNPMPDRVRLLSAETTHGEYTAAADIWEIGELDVGETAELELTVTVEEGGSRAGSDDRTDR